MAALRLQGRLYMVAQDRQATPSALLLFNVDNFKLVDDTLGHAGGNEFTALPEGATMSEAKVIAERRKILPSVMTMAPCQPSA